jgi:MFS family permease
VAFWSLATALAGFAQNLTQLVLLRSLVGVGEAAYGTIAPPFISDFFPPHERNIAFGFFYLAIPMGKSPLVSFKCHSHQPNFTKAARWVSGSALPWALLKGGVRPSWCAVCRACWPLLGVSVSMTQRAGATIPLISARHQDPRHCQMRPHNNKQTSQLLGRNPSLRSLKPPRTWRWTLGSFSQTRTSHGLCWVSQPTILPWEGEPPATYLPMNTKAK